MRVSLILLCLSVAGCGRDEPAPPVESNRTAAVPASNVPRGETRPTPAESRTDESAGRDAAAVLRRYYDHIEGGRYRDAWAMRSESDEGYDRFERNFAGYDRYKVSLGPATRPVEAGGWAYVEVPIQIFGTMKGGKGFGSVGNVTMRKAVKVPDATPRQRRWHIYTG
ncbi:hypothetical protein [Sphingosinicella sp. BN140058]|uniref:hypothetical protein n=1 Tax=Sphingosinicella sp. BN140058 TaxID=1892855 RepID=UPI00101199CD|nr:hypothetical protein [Sphingosinicella sp. BN140058]QAY77729.1 hypothetical protein ETR14_15310 [Sphingosinicella sp. BN140058]